MRTYHVAISNGLASRIFLVKNLGRVLRLFLTVISIFGFLISQSQQIGFFQKADTFYIEKGETAEAKIILNCTGCLKETIIKAKLEPLPSTYPSGSFSVYAYPDSIEITASKQVSVGVEIRMDDPANYGKTIGFKLTDHARPGKDPQYFYIYVLKPEIKADSSDYRLMIGTNFDFIDGIQPKHVYYHLQFFTPQAFSKRFGFVGGIQQNRQVSQRDTAFNEIVRNQGKFFSDSVRYSAYTTVGQDSFRIHRLDSVNFRQIATSTVFQIYFEPTFKLYKINKPQAQTDIYGFLHADLNYRRTKFEETYTFKKKDSIVVDRASFSKYTTVSSAIRITSVDNFEYYYGAGLMIHHENKYVDLYAKFMLGKVTVAKRDTRSYYASELGIRVPAINIMFGWEYRGLFRQHNPNYLNVYLSKVVSLSKLFDFILN